MVERRKLLHRYRDLFAEPMFDAFLGGSGYANYGYWEDGTRDGKAACDNLVDRLLRRLPGSPGAILDVACGQGGTTRRLTEHYPQSRVAAINLSAHQLAAARRRAPGCAFACMDAAHLAFADSSFDAILCVEAAFHFDTRERFLREARRVLRPGGTLLLTDVIARTTAGRMPRQNLVASLPEYAELLRREGFRDVAVEDASARTWHAFRRRYAAFVLARSRVLDLLRRAPHLLWLYPWRYLVTRFAIAHYLIASARRAP